MFGGREKLDLELELATSGAADRERPRLARTRAVSASVLERLSLLLHVTIMPEGGAGVGGVSRSHSTSHTKPVSIMVRSDTDVLKGSTLHAQRSLSVPPPHEQGSFDDSVLEITRLQT